MPSSRNASDGQGGRPAREAPALLMVGNFLSTAGGNRSVCEELFARLTASGLHVLSTSSHAGRARRLLDMLQTAWQQRARYQVAQVDVFSGPAFVWAEAVCGVLRLLGKPYVLTLHGGSLPDFAQRHPRRVRRLLQSAAAVTTPSRFLLETFATLRGDTIFIGNGLTLKAYPFRARGPIAPRLVWLRAFHRVYNPGLAVRTLERIVRRFPDARLTMIGPDKGDGTLQATIALAASLGLRDRVTFPGPVPKEAVGAALAEHDLFLNTTHVDNAPVSVLEAMACGLCVVTTKVGGLPFLVDDGRDGLLVPADDEQAMAGAVERLLDDDTLAARLSKEARAKAERFDWTPIVEEWRTLLASAAGGDPRVPTHRRADRRGEAA